MDNQLLVLMVPCGMEHIFELSPQVTLSTVRLFVHMLPNLILTVSANCHCDEASGKNALKAVNLLVSVTLYTNHFDYENTIVCMNNIVMFHAVKTVLFTNLPCIVCEFIHHH